MNMSKILSFLKPNFQNANTSLAGLFVVVLGAITSSPVGQPFSQNVHDWATFLAFVAAGLGLHSAADAARSVRESAPAEKVADIAANVVSGEILRNVIDPEKKS